MGGHGTYVNDIVDGELKEYYKNGLVNSEVNYDMGEIRGKKNSFYDNGAFKQVENYYNGKLDSWRRVYYANGLLKKEEYYKDGKLIRSKDYNEDGFLVSTSGY